MNFTDVLRLPCPSDGDYAALSVYMQRLAEEIEAKILAQRALISDETNPPTAIWIGPNIAIGPFSTASIVELSTPGQGFGVFTNYTVNGNLPQVSATKGLTFNEAGVWHFGFCITSVASGAVTNDSNRLFRVQIAKGTSGGTQQIELFGRHINAEATIATDFLTGQAVFNVDTETAKYGINTVFTHTNAASNVSIPVNGVYYWATRIGSTDSIEVL